MKPVVQALKAELKRSFPMHTDLVSDSVDRALVTQQKTVADVRTWFDTVMDRTADRFVMHTRIVTGAVAVALVLVLQIDSVSIFQQLASNPDLRTKLVLSSQAILEKAEEMQVFEENSVQAASQALSTIATDSNYPALNELPPVPEDLATFNQGSQWVKGLKDVSAADSKEFLDLFGKKFEAQNVTTVQSLKTATQEITTYLEESQLDLFAASWLVRDQSGQSPSNGFTCKRGIGLFISMIFLGLGAPFWYNILNQLSTLRPLIARKIEAKPGE